MTEGRAQHDRSMAPSPLSGPSVTVSPRTTRQKKFCSYIYTYQRRILAICQVQARARCTVEQQIRLWPSVVLCTDFQTGSPLASRRGTSAGGPEAAWHQRPFNGVRLEAQLFAMLRAGRLLDSKRMHCLSVFLRIESLHGGM